MKRIFYMCLALCTTQPLWALQADSSQALLNTYCITCHNERAKTGGLTLDKLDIQHVGENAETWEKVVRKLRSGMMPPSGARRPDRATLDGFVTSLESALDRAAAAKPNPGTTALHRMNRTEYGNAVRDVIGLEIDTSVLFPGDDSTDGFDNIADVLGVSPALLERYMSAAAKISRIAVGDPSIAASTATYRVRGDLSQTDHIEGLPLGTRGGMLIGHNFPLDAEYTFKFGFLRTAIGALFGGAAPDEQLEITVDGVRVQLLKIGNTGVPEIRLPIKAGPHSIGVAFLRKTAATVDDLWQPPARSTADTYVGQQVGYTTLPHLASVAITGPFNVSGPGDTASRRKIFVCRPATADEELPCARKIVSTLARHAYRRPVRCGRYRSSAGLYTSRSEKAERSIAELKRFSIASWRIPNLYSVSSGTQPHAAPGDVIESAISNWLHGSLFSCGAVSRMTNCWISPAKES